MARIQLIILTKVCLGLTIKLLYIIQFECTPQKLKGRGKKNGQCQFVCKGKPVFQCVNVPFLWLVQLRSPSSLQCDKALSPFPNL